MKIFNSAKKTKENIEINENKIKIYVCGPTVYDYSHLGHARSAITFDLLHRVLKENKISVEFVKNFTDIDDKIINKMEKENKSLKEITELYIKAYKEDMDKLNVLPVIELKATDNINEMIRFIEALIEKKYAYIGADGVYFDTTKYKNYGTLFNRVEERENITEKRNEKDFALWKFKNDLEYDASFGKGRPGWHTECVAMIKEHLAYKDEEYMIDIHGGGDDLAFPHHENEAAQAAAFNQSLSKYWMHNGFVKINGEKMSKSLGNSFYLKDVFEKYDGEVIRFYLMTNHYRTNFDFNEIDLIASKKRLDKLYRLKKRVIESENKKVENNIIYEEMLNALNDDLNTPIVLSLIDNFINESNEKLDLKQNNEKNFILDTIEKINKLIGIGYQNPYKYFQFGLKKEDLIEIESKILERQNAKENKDFKKADEIREELKNNGIAIMDTKFGTVFEKVE